MCQALIHMMCILYARLRTPRHTNARQGQGHTRAVLGKGSFGQWCWPAPIAPLRCRRAPHRGDGAWRPRLREGGAVQGTANRRRQVLEFAANDNSPQNNFAVPLSCSCSIKFAGQRPKKNVSTQMSPHKICPPLHKEQREKQWIVRQPQAGRQTGKHRASCYAEFTFDLAIEIFRRSLQHG